MALAFEQDRISEARGRVELLRAAQQWNNGTGAEHHQQCGGAHSRNARLAGVHWREGVGTSTGMWEFLVVLYVYLI